MRVVQGSGFLMDFVKDARRGSLMPAVFQRPYSWSRDDVEALWTSIIRGWPTGSLMVWERPHGIAPAMAGRGRIGPIENDGEDWGAMLLDGQNRIATLAWSILAPGDDRPDLDPDSIEAQTWGEDAVLVCDADLERVLFVTPEEADTGNRLPVAAILDMRLLRTEVDRMTKEGRWDGNQVPDHVLTWSDKVGNRLREARISHTSLERASMDEAVEAFVHIARTGVPMSEEDIRNALSWTTRSEPEAEAGLPGMRP